MRQVGIGAALVVAIALVAVPVSAQQQEITRPSGTHAVACSSAFAKDSSHLKLTTAFGSKNVTFTEVEAGDGSKVPSSVLFPNDPKRRLEVWWSDPATRKVTYLIVIGGESNWSAPGGLRLGQSVEQLEKLNHKPFKLKGFDKDHVATVSDWDGGALGMLAGGCKAGVSLRADVKTSAAALTALAADKEFSSSDKAMRAAKPKVSEILIGY
jgi:hypothetical protein